MTASAQAIRQLARQLGRLSPDWQNPERFFERRDEIERELRQLARRVEAGDRG